MRVPIYLYIYLAVYVSMSINILSQFQLDQLVVFGARLTHEPHSFPFFAFLSQTGRHRLMRVIVPVCARVCVVARGPQVRGGCQGAVPRCGVTGGEWLCNGCVYLCWCLVYRRKEGGRERKRDGRGSIQVEEKEREKE